MITITQIAQQELARLNSENKALRIQIVGGGCSGLEYKMEFVEGNNLVDKVYNIGDIKIVIDPKSAKYMEGMELDYQGGLNGKGFVYRNPIADRMCGCGNSFSIKE